MKGASWEKDGCYWGQRLMAEWFGAMVVTRVNEEQEVVYAAENVLSFLNDTSETFLQRCRHGFMALVDAEDRELVRAEIAQQLGCWNSYAAEYRLLKGDGDVIWVADRGTAVRDEQGQQVIIRLLADITSRRKLHEQLMRRAQIDPLTEIYNRGIIETEIDYYLRHCANKSLSALFILDLDNFKKVNDLYGHMAGDQVLVDMAYTLQESFRNGDIIGRLGGDEFLVLMKAVRSKEDVIKKAQMICEVVRKRFEEPFQQAGLSVSIGVLLIDGDTRVAFEEAYCAADNALYQAKLQGKNGYWISDGGADHLCEC